MSLSSDPLLLELLRTTHTAISRCVLITPEGVEYDLPVVGGSVTVDARRSVRRSMSLETLDLDGTLTATGYYAPLNPFGAELQAYRGVMLPDNLGKVEVLLGTFRVTAVDLRIGADGALRVSVSGEDRAYYVSRMRYSRALEVPNGTRISDPSTSAPGVMQRILDNLSGLASFPRSLPTLTSNLGSYKWFGSDPEEDPWFALMQLAQCVGYEVYFTNEGTITASLPPGLTGDPTWEYLQDENNVVLGLSRSLSAENIYNGVQLQSQSGSAVSGEAYDEDPNSPTSARPPFGKRPIRFDNPYLRTVAQARSAASRLLPLYVGQPIRWEQVPNPAMDVRDRVRIVESRLGLDVTAIVDAFTIPLDPGGTMTVEGRVA